MFRHAIQMIQCISSNRIIICNYPLRIESKIFLKGLHYLIHFPYTSSKDNGNSFEYICHKSTSHTKTWSSENGALLDTAIVGMQISSAAMYNLVNTRTIS